MHPGCVYTIWCDGLVAVPTLDLLWTTASYTTLSMNSAEQANLILHAVNPRKENAAIFLNDLGLAGLPSREQINRDIESKLLLPPTEFPKQLLSTYQV
jgi:hypothetical protein